MVIVPKIVWFHHVLSTFPLSNIIYLYPVDTYTSFLSGLNPPFRKYPSWIRHTSSEATAGSIGWIMFNAHFLWLYIHTYMHAYIHTYRHTYIHSYIHTYILRTYIHTYTHIHTYIHAYLHTFIHSVIHTYIHTLLYTINPSISDIPPHEIRMKSLLTGHPHPWPPLRRQKPWRRASSAASMRRSSPMASSLSHGNFQAWGLHPEKNGG
jgi:hypothetical protein